MIEVVVAAAIFLACLGLIFSEKVNRTIAAFAGAVVMVGAGKIFNFYNETEAIAAIDFNTLGLLLGMMVLVALLEPTGFFQYLAVWAARLSRGQPVRLLILLGSVTTVLSMFLDNVTTVVLIAPVTILICEILGVSALPYLMAEALLSDTGGVATLVGDPPNVLISSVAGFTFNDFLTHSLPMVLIAWLAALLLIRYLFRKELSIPPTNPDAIQLLDLDQTLHDRTTTRRVLIVLGAALLALFIHGWLQVSPAYIALTAAAAALIWLRPEPGSILQRVEWNVLVFFATLFIIVGGLEAAGALDGLVSLLESAGSVSPILFGVILIWLVAGISAIVDNIPVTIALIPVIQGLGASGMDINPLWWALVFGAGFGGNGTIIGSTANIVVTNLSEKTNSPITARLWNRRGLPVMLVTCLIASIFYVIAYPLLQR
jgi:Na+/H+ antiporter NhaD/arsenite permease-like protein